MKSGTSILCLLALATADEIDPKIYAKLFLNNRPLFERMATAVEDYLPALTPKPSSAKVLDLGSGPGEPTLTLLTKVKCRVVCTDVQPAMNEKARARIKAAGVDDKVDFAVTSADDLSQWKKGEFDAVMMSFVLMFVPDKAKSIKEVARVLKPEGAVFIAVWKHFPFYDLAHNAVEEVAGKKMPPFEINPMTLSADHSVEKLSASTGLAIFSRETLTYEFRMGSTKDTADGTMILASSMLKQLEKDGKIDAIKKFYAIIDRMVRENGWVTQGEAGEVVTIPDCTAKMTVLQKTWDNDLEL